MSPSEPNPTVSVPSDPPDTRSLPSNAPAPDAPRTVGVTPEQARAAADRVLNCPAPRPTSPPADGPGSFPVIPGYEVLGVLGRGGMGVVYRARQVGLSRDVALKMVLGAEWADPRVLVRFLAEGEAVAAVRHPHVVQVYECGSAGGVPFLVMEYLPGGSLADRLKGRRPAVRAVAGLVEKLARAVQAAHEQGIVHRDLKPGNVLFDDRGEPKVTDFGLARRGRGQHLTFSAEVAGTPAYMAPEQATGTGVIGLQADVWALGVILYECLTGSRPFDGDTHLAILQKLLTEAPARPRAANPLIPRDLELICLRCLEKTPHERYGSASSLADDLDRFLRGEPVSVRPAGVLERGYKWARRKPTLAAAYSLMLLAVALTGLTAGAVWLWRQAEEARGNAESERAIAEGAKEAAEMTRDQLRVANRQLDEARGLVESTLAAERRALATVATKQLPRVHFLLIYETADNDSHLAEEARREEERVRELVSKLPVGFQGKVISCSGKSLSRSTILKQLAVLPTGPMDTLAVVGWTGGTQADRRTAEGDPEQDLWLSNPDPAEHHLLRTELLAAITRKGCRLNLLITGCAFPDPLQRRQEIELRAPPTSKSSSSQLRPLPEIRPEDQYAVFLDLFLNHRGTLNINGAKPGESGLVGVFPEAFLELCERYDSVGSSLTWEAFVARLGQRTAERFAHLVQSSPHPTGDTSQTVFVFGAAKGRGAYPQYSPWTHDMVQSLVKRSQHP